MEGSYLYSYDDIKKIEKELKRFLLYFLIATIIFIGVLIVICRNWGTELDPYRLPPWPAYAAGVIYAVGAVFTWSFVGAKIIKYRGFVYSILNGLDRTIQGQIIAVNNNITYDNDLEFYKIEITGDEKEENRYLYLDARKDIDTIEVGNNVKLKIFGNYIKDILS